MGHTKLLKIRPSITADKSSQKSDPKKDEN